MDNQKLVNTILEYEYLIEDEIYENVIEEMLVDLKSFLLSNSTNVSNNYSIIETFYNIKMSGEVLSNLKKLRNELTDDTVITEGVIAGISKAISKMKSGFGDKHNKIVERDKKWLNKNKKVLLGLDYTEVELEVLSDYKVTFEQLLNRHNIFDKIFVNSENMEDIDSKLARFTDKNDNLKNGLDNYFRTGTSRREIGLRKVSGDEAKLVVENMIAYCESFLSGKSFMEEKLNKILVEVNDSKIEESYSLIDILKEAVKDDELEDDEFDDIDDEELEDDNEKVKEEPKENKHGIKDRQIGIGVLLTVAEERYFDYINILKGLIEE